MTEIPITKEERELEVAWASRPEVFGEEDFRGVRRAILKYEAALATAEKQIPELRKALKPFLNLFNKNPETGKREDQLEGLPDGHAFRCVWETEDDKSPWISAGHVRAARKAYEESDQK